MDHETQRRNSRKNSSHEFDAVVAVVGGRKRRIEAEDSCWAHIKRRRKPLTDVKSKELNGRIEGDGRKDDHENKSKEQKTQSTTIVCRKDGKLDGRLTKKTLPVNLCRSKYVSCFKGDHPKLSRDCDFLILLPRNPPVIIEQQTVDDCEHSILEYLFNLEVRRKVPREYVERDSKINAHIRAVLIDWLIQIQDNVGLEQETLNLTVMAMDRILFKHELALAKVQLLAVASLFIMSKLEERFPPEIKTLVRLTDNAYNRDDVIIMESFILRELKFDLIMAEPMIFLNKFIRCIREKNNKVKYLSMYLLDTFLLNKQSAVVMPSQQSAAALCLARCILKGHTKEMWNETLKFYTTYCEQSLYPIMHQMLVALIRTDNSPYQAVKLKFSCLEKYEGVSRMAAVSGTKLLLLLQKLTKYPNQY